MRRHISCAVVCMCLCHCVCLCVCVCFQPLLSSHKTSALYGSGQVHEENLGSIQFSLEYDTDTSLLTLELMQASDLVSPDTTDTLPDPYVIVRLLPDFNNQLQTRTHRQTRCPYLDERFIFDVAWSELAGRSLEMRIYHDRSDESRRDDCIGQVTVPLDQLDLVDKCVICKGLSAAEKQVQYYYYYYYYYYHHLHHHNHHHHTTTTAATIQYMLISLL